MQFSLVEMWKTMGLLAKFVVIVLAIMSMFSLGVIVERFFTFLRAQRQSVSYVVSLRGYIQGRRLRDAVGVAMGHKHSPLAKVIGAGISEYVQGLEALHQKGPEDVGEFDLVDAVNRSLERVKEREVADLRRGLGTLATVGSSAPFVGLFGTVVGILKAFQSMSVAGTGGFKVVSQGIAAALVATAAGLMVAIYAVIAYNYFVARINSISMQYRLYCEEFLSALGEQGSKPRTAAAPTPAPADAAPAAS